MKKRGTKILAGFATVAMFAVTGFVGAQSFTGKNIAETVETVEYKAEENLSDAPYSVKNLEEITDYKYLSDLEKALPEGYGRARVRFKGYDIDALLVADPGQVTQIGIGIQAKIYTEKPGRNVKCIGEIYTNGPMRMGNGILYANSLEGWENPGIPFDAKLSYDVSKDGEKLIVKDYISFRFRGLVDYYGFTNHDGNNNYHAVTDLDEAYNLSSSWIDKFNHADIVYFDIKG